MYNRCGEKPRCFSTTTTTTTAPAPPLPQVMSTEHHFVPGTPQWAWLEGDLAAVDRSITPWVVLVGHRWAVLWRASGRARGWDAQPCAVAIAG